MVIYLQLEKTYLRFIFQTLQETVIIKTMDYYV